MRLVVRRLQVGIAHRRFADVLARNPAARIRSATISPSASLNAGGRRTSAGRRSSSTRPAYIVGAEPKLAISSANLSEHALEKLERALGDGARLRAAPPECGRAVSGVSGALTPPGTIQEGCTRSWARPSMICWPNLRSATPVARQLGILFDQAENVAARRVGIEAQQQVGRRKVEEAERVGLHVLRAMDQFAQLDAGLGRRHRHDGVAGLGGGQQVAHRADAADARGDGGHLVKRPALGELLESAHLGDVELRVGDAGPRRRGRCRFWRGLRCG